MNFTSKTFWLVLGVSVATLSLGAFASEMHLAVQAGGSSPQQTTKLVGAPVLHTPAPVSYDQKLESANVLLDMWYPFQYPKKTFELMKGSDAEILEIVALAQSQVSAERKMSMNRQISAACFAVGKFDCFHKLDAEVRNDENFSSLEREYKSTLACYLFYLPYAQIGAIQEDFLNSYKDKQLYPFWHLSYAIAQLNTSQLRYLVNFYEEIDEDTSCIDYDKIPTRVFENCQFLPTSEEEIKEAVKLIKRIRGFSLGELIASINDRVKSNTFYTPKQVAGLIAYKDALIKYWDLE